MPVFVFLVFLAAVLLWLLLSFVFIPLGKLVCRLVDDALKAMSEDTLTNNKNKGDN